METQKAVTLLLIRHGQAQSNVSRILTSYPEAVPMRLSSTGRKEAKKTAASLIGIQVEALFASPLTRTQETALIISEAVGVPVVTDNRLRETDFGMYNNTSYLQFFTRYPHPKLRRKMAKESHAEGLEEVRKRAEDFLQMTKKNFTGKTVIAVTHADVIREIMNLVEGKDTWGSVPTASVHKLVLKENG